MLDANLPGAYPQIGQFHIGALASGAGLEIDCEGNLWAVDQSNEMIYQAESGESASLCSPDTVPWFAEEPISGTVVPSDSLGVDIGWWANVAEVDQPGDYYASLKIKNNDPAHQNLVLPVTMTVTAPPTWGRLTGVVSSTGYCDVNPHPIEGARVYLEGSSGYTCTLETDAGGIYQRWLDSTESPYTVTVSSPEHPTTVASVAIVAGATTTQNFVLRWQQPCISVTVPPAGISATLDMGMSTTFPMSISNSGAVVLDFELHEEDRGVEITMLSAVRVPGYQASNLETQESFAGPRLVSRDSWSYQPSSETLMSAASVDVLLFASDDVTQIQAMLAAYPDINLVDYYDGRLGTPLLADLLAYDTVVVMSNFAFADNVAAGDVLADYIDVGGTGVQLNGTFNTGAGWALQGRFLTDGYSPYFDSPNIIFSTVSLGAYDASHPIMQGVTAASDQLLHNELTLKPESTFVADWDDGEGLVGTKGSVVGFNAFLSDGGRWTGNLDLILHNSIIWLQTGGDASWLFEDPITGTVPSDGGLAPIDVTLDAAHVAQPGEYHATLNVNSNDPVNSRVGVPVTMTVNVPATWGKLQGAVTSLGHCDVNPAPLKDAEVLLAGGTTVSVTTDVSGTYAYWIEEGTYLVIVSADEHLSDIAMVNVTAGTTTTQDFALRWLKPCVSVAPAAISTVLDMGMSTTLPMSISNSGAAVLEFELQEQDRGFQPATLGLAAGHGTWLYRSEKGVLMQTNRGDEELAYPSAYRWQPAGFLSALNILIYADDVVHASPNTFLDQALQALGLAYTAHYDGDWTGFEADLTGGTWDLVLVGNDNWGPPSSVWTALNNYVIGSGKLVYHGWTVGRDPGNTLWTTLGFTWVSDDGNPPDPVYWWEPGHPIFTNPESVPEFTSLTGGIYGTYGQHVEPLAGFDPLAGYTTPGPDMNEAALILGNDDCTMFKGFLDGQNGADLDSDTVLDGVELWENIIYGLLNGFGGDAPWLSEDPITGTVPSNGGLAPIDVTLDAARVAQPGEYYATLNVKSDDPVNSRIGIPVTMTVNLPATYGKLQGTVTSLGYCDVNTNTLEGAQVLIEGHPLTLTTDVSGTYVLWLNQGTYTVTASYAEHLTATTEVIITAQTTTTQDFVLRWLQPCVSVVPASISVTLDMALSTTLPISISNNGAAALEFEIGEANRGFVPLIATFRPLAPPPDYAGLNSDQSSEFPVVPTAPWQLLGTGALLIQDSAAWGYNAIETILTNNGIPYDVINSSQIATTNFTPYRMIIIPSVQGSTYNATFNANLTKFEDFVDAGGLVIMSFCEQSSYMPYRAIPFGGINNYGSADDNYIVEPDHPIFAGVPNPYWGSSASHSYLTGLLPGDRMLVTAGTGPGGNVVMIERDHGAGMLVAGGQTFEWGWGHGQGAGTILENMIPHYYFNWVGGGDVPWLFEDPITGTVPSDGGLAPIDVTLNAAYVAQPGEYYATLNVKSNDPVNDRIGIPVTMTVEPDPDMGKLGGTVTADRPAGPLEGALVEVISGTTTVISGTTDGSGGYGPWWLTNGTYSITVSAMGYFPDEQTVTITARMTTTHDVVLLSSYVMGAVAYVTLSDSNLVALVDTASHTVMGTVNVGAVGCDFPWRATMSPAGDYVYVGCYDSDNVAVIETAGNTVVATVGGINAADGIAFTRDGAYALVGSRWSNQIAVVNTTTYAVTTFIPTPDEARSVVTHPYLDRAYATCANGTIQVIDTTDFSIVEAISVGGEPWDVAVSPDGRWVFTGDYRGGGLVVIAAGSNTLYTTVTGLGDLTGLEVAPDGSKVYACGRWNGVHVIDGVTFNRITTIPGIGSTWEAAVTCDGSELYVGNESNQVPVVDTAAAVLTDTIDMPGSGSCGIAICPQFRLPGLYLYPTAQSGYETPGESVVYDEFLVNGTGQTDSFDLARSGNTWDTDISLTNTGPLSDGAWISFTVQVTIPVSASAGDGDTALIQAASVASPTVYSDTATIATTALCTPNLTFAGQSTWAGNLDDTYDYGGQLFTRVYLYAYTTSGGTSINATVSGYNADAGMWETIGDWWYVGSQLLVDGWYVPPVYSQIRVELRDNWGAQVYYDYQFIVCREPAVDLSPSSQQSFAQAGTTAVYTQTVTNYMMVTDSFDLSASGNSWPTTLWDGAAPVTNTGPLADMETFTVTVKVDVPAGASMGDSDAATIQARSVASPAISDTASLRTTVLAHPWVQAFSDYWAPDGSTDRDQYLDIVRSSGVVTAQVTDDWDWQNSPPAVAAYPREAIVAAWTSPQHWNGMAWYCNIEYAAHDADGNTVIPVTQVSDNISATISTYDYNPAPAVAPADGNVLIPWYRYEGDWMGNWSYNVYYAVRGPAGSEVLSPTALTTNTTSTVQDYSPSAAAFDDGHFAVAWQHRDDATGANDIYYAVLSSAGGLIAGPVNLTHNTWEDDYSPRANRLNDGNVLLTWYGDHGFGHEIYYAVLDSAGNVVYPATRLTDVPHSAYYPDAVGLRNGNTVVAWEQYGYYPNWGRQMAYAVLDSACTTIVATHILTNTLENWNYYVSLASDSDDNAVLTWRDGDRQHIYYAVVDNSGAVRTWPLVFRTARGRELDISWWGAGNGSLPGPLLTLDKAAAPDPVGAGGTLVYTLTYGNAGSSPISGVVLTETYDANVTFAAADPPPDVGNNVWNIGDLPNGVIGTVVITVEIASPLPNGTLLHNQATLDAPDTEASVASADTVVTSAPIWTLLKSDAPDPVEAGRLLVYTIAYGNSGNEDATGVVITETYDANATFVTADPAPTSGDNVWAIGPVSVGLSDTIVVTVEVASPLPDGTLLNNRVALDSDQSGPVEHSITTTATSTSVWLLTKSDSTDPVAEGSTLVYTVTYGNVGNENATGVSLVETYPSQITFVAADPSPSLGNAVWSIGTLYASVTDTIVITVEVDAPLPNGTVLTNTVIIAGNEIASLSVDETTLMHTPTPVLSISKTDDPDPVKAGGLLTYTLVVQNTGNANATGVTINDTIPANTIFVSADSGGSLAGDQIRWTGKTVNAGSNLTVTFAVTVTSPLPDGTVVTNDDYGVICAEGASATGSPVTTTVQSASVLSISEVRVTNVRDTTSNVSWVTDQSATGEVHYGTDPANLDQTAYDDRGAGTSDDTHYVTLVGLTSNTTYYFDVVSGSTTDDKGGAHYTVTTGPTLDLPALDTIYGQVFKEDGTTPAEGTIVYITLRDADGSGSPGQAAPLSALVDSDGWWFTNLGNARLPDLSAYFTYSVSGDQVWLKAQGAADGVGCHRVDTANDTPAVPPIVLNDPSFPCTIVAEIPLQIGWNHISLPLDPATSYTAEGVCSEINSQGGNVAEIDRWYASGWDSHICGLPFNDFSIALGSDYFIKSNAVSTWTIEGWEVTTGVPLDLQIGWNSIGVPHTDAYTAESLCTEIISQGVTAIEIDRWGAGGWDGHICGLPFNDFSIEIGKGYFVKAGSSGTVTPAMMMMVSQSRGPESAPAALPEAVPATAVAIRDLRVSNLRDTAVTLSWITGEPATGYVLFGETPAPSTGSGQALGRVAYDVRGQAIAGDTHYVVLTDLAPETTYYFDVVSGDSVDDNGGAHYTVTTGPQLDSLPESDTVHGQVFRAGGVTPAARAIVYLTLMDADGTGSASQAMLISALVDANGYWHANLGNARLSDGSTFAYSTAGDAVTLVAQGATVGFITQAVDTGAMRPAAPLIPVWQFRLYLPLVIRE